MDFYKTLKENLNKFPSDILHKINFFIDQNLFTKYSSIDGLIYVLKKMENKTVYESNLVTSIDKFISFSPKMELQFFIFFEDMINAVNKYFIEEHL